MRGIASYCTLVFAGALFLFSCQSPKQEKIAEGKRPNILFLFADDQRAGTINVHGNDEIITPNIDKLADIGVSFTNAYIMGGSSGAVCGPGIPENERRNALCYLFDIFPTLCELTAMEVPETVQGISFAQAIVDNETIHRETMVYGYKEYQRAYRKGDYKLIEYFVNGERNTQLFNLKEDPIEFNNFFGDEKFDLIYSELKEEMLERMKLMNDTGEIYQKLVEPKYK